LAFFVYEKCQKKACWACGSLAVIGWGKQQGKQRFKCKSCGMMFTRTSPEVALKNQFVWFEKWVSERQIYKYLIRDSGLSQSSIQRLFKHYLAQAPEVLIKSKTSIYLMLLFLFVTNYF
jgi:transposase-like protein